jgi:LysM domain
LLGVIGLLLYLHRGDAEGSARIANREIDFLLARGEQVGALVPVMQRHWWNSFRVTHGIVAATNQRLIYVGVPPERLLPHEEEPPELEERSWRYNAPLEVRPERVFHQTRPGFIVRGGTDTAGFAIASRNADRLDSVVAVVDRGRLAIRTAQEAERMAVEASAAAARQPVYHLVQSGESLFGIAARYGIDVDSLRAWNHLVRDRILVGQRLLVSPGS